MLTPPLTRLRVRTVASSSRALRPPARAQVLKKIVWYAVLTPRYSTPEGSSSDVTTLVASTAAYRQLSDLPLHKGLLAAFSNHEIMRWGLFEATYGGEMAAEADVFGGEHGARHLEALKLRLIEHNVLVIARYYTRISTARLAELLDLTPDQVGRAAAPTDHSHVLAGAARCDGAGSQRMRPRCCSLNGTRSVVDAAATHACRCRTCCDQAEKQLSELVVAKAVAAKIDRPAGVVAIGKTQQPEDVLNGWSANITKLLGLVEKATGQIQKEAMVHKVAI